MRYKRGELDSDQIAAAAAWLGDSEYALLIVDTIEGAGLSVESNNAEPWYIHNIDPFLESGTSALILDHAVKRQLEKPPGPIGSQRKRARVDMSLEITGKAWSKSEDGAIALRFDKDRYGDSPESQVGKVVCIIAGKWVGGVLQYTIERPKSGDDMDAGDMGMNILGAIAAEGDKGMRGQRKVRDSVRGKGVDKDNALSELVGAGMVDKVMNGNTGTYFATALGMMTLEQGQG